MKTATQFFKVLGPDYKSCNGGSLEWPLPNGNKPGKWVSVAGELRMCRNGIHLTTMPWKWRRKGARLYLVEHGNEYIYESGDKACFRRVRLIQEVTLKDKLLFARLDIYLFVWIGAKDRGTKVPNLSEANLSGAYLSGADLSWANLSGANLRWAYLRGAYLSGADISEANLSGADISEANLSGADLRWADLRGADLRGANLSEADISGAYRPNNPPKGYTTNKNGYLVKE